MTIFFDLPQPNPTAITRSKALSECIKQEMLIQGGQISFSRFMELSLYHPQFGYYNSATFDIGQSGDFTTAAEISPLYAHCFAKQVLQLFDELGAAHILEIGAGTGRFAGDIFTELLQLGCLVDRYYIYEISAHLRTKQQHFLKTTCPAFFHHFIWLDTLPDSFIGIIIANEVLDALPVHCFKIDSIQIKEKCVTWDKNQFIWTNTLPTTNELSIQVDQLQKLYSLTPNYESEINLGLSSFIHTLTQCLAKGILLFADYGYGQKEYYHPERQQGTLTCFYQHRCHHNPLILPGLQDITSHVDFTRVAEAAVENECQVMGYTTQAAFLLSCGLMNIASQQEKKLTSLDEFHLHQNIKLLTLPTEMGERVKIMALSKMIALPLLGFRLLDRRRDL